MGKSSTSADGRVPVSQSSALVVWRLAECGAVRMTVGLLFALLAWLVWFVLADRGGLGDGDGRHMEVVVWSDEWRGRLNVKRSMVRPLGRGSLFPFDGGLAHEVRRPTAASRAELLGWSFAGHGGRRRPVRTLGGQSSPSPSSHPTTTVDQSHGLVDVHAHALQRPGKRGDAPSRTVSDPRATDVHLVVVDVVQGSGGSVRRLVASAG